VLCFPGETGSFRWVSAAFGTGVLGRRGEEDDRFCGIMSLLWSGNCVGISYALVISAFFDGWNKGS
jgi:hypothetical protein